VSPCYFSLILALRFSSNGSFNKASWKSSYFNRVPAHLHPDARAHVEEALEKLCETLGGWNWGELTFSNVDTELGMGKFSVKNSLEARVKKAGDNFGCHFLSNFMAGFLSELFGRNVSVKERRCASWEGRSCKFEFQVVGNGE